MFIVTTQVWTREEMIKKLEEGGGKNIETRIGENQGYFFFGKVSHKKLRCSRIFVKLIFPNLNHLKITKPLSTCGNFLDKTLFTI